MNGIFAYALQILTGVLDQSRAFFDAVTLHAPGILAAVAVLALCVMAAGVVLDASRRTAAVPAWSYLRQDVAQLAADRDSKRSLLDSLRAECRTLEGALEGLRAEKAHLTGLAERREEQEAALRDLSERLAKPGGRPRPRRSYTGGTGRFAIGKERAGAGDRGHAGGARRSRERPGSAARSGGETRGSGLGPQGLAGSHERARQPNADGTRRFARSDRNGARERAG